MQTTSSEHERYRKHGSPCFTRLPADFTIDTNLLSCNALNMKTNLRFWAFMVLGVFPCALRADVSETEHGESIEETVYKELAYVSDGHARQKLDLYLPEGKGPFPVLVWIHGGAWRAGRRIELVGWIG